MGRAKSSVLSQLYHERLRRARAGSALAYGRRALLPLCRAATRHLLQLARWQHAATAVLPTGRVRASYASTGKSWIGRSKHVRQLTLVTCIVPTSEPHQMSICARSRLFAHTLCKGTFGLDRSERLHLRRV